MLESWLLVEPPPPPDELPTAHPWGPLLALSRRALSSVLPPPPSSSHSSSCGRLDASRSVVTHAIVRHATPTTLTSLPSDLMLQVLASLDALTLCRLARVSVALRQLADDPVVWRAACGCRGHHVGHCKDHARLRHVQACMWAKEIEARAERRRKLVFRMWKRRVMSCLQAVCGAALILFPLILLSRRVSGSGRGGHGESGKMPLAAGLMKLGAGTLSSSPGSAHAHDAPHKLLYADVVWDAACSHRRPSPRGA